MRSGAIDVLVVDSVAAMVTKAEIDGEMGDTHVGLLARLMSQAMRKLTSVIGKSNCVAIFINQVREKIGVVYGNPETTPGGRALKFYSSVRIEVRKGEALKSGSEIVGNRTRCKIVKNKVAPPFKEAEFDIMYGEGCSLEGEIVDLGASLDIINRSGAWFSYNGERLGQGRDNVKEVVRNNPELKKELYDKIMENKDQLVMSSRKAKKEAAQKAALSADKKGPAQAAVPAALAAPVKAAEVVAKSVQVEADEADFDS